MKLTMEKLRDIIAEELTKSDKSEIKTIVSKEIDSSISAFEKKINKMVQDELKKLLKTRSTKDEVGDITKKILKKLYKDLSLHHPYIIDRIKL
jgi:glutamyl-tRNA reductase